MLPTEIPDSVMDLHLTSPEISAPPMGWKSFRMTWMESRQLLAHFWPAIEAHIMARHGITPPDPVRDAARNVLWKAIGGKVARYPDQEHTDMVADAIYHAIVEAQKRNAGDQP